MVPPGVLATSNGHSGVDREWFGNTNLENSSLLGDARGGLSPGEGVLVGLVGGYISKKTLIPDYHRPNTNMGPPYCHSHCLCWFFFIRLSQYTLSMYYYNNFRLFAIKKERFCSALPKKKGRSYKFIF